jgi:hypothetical protein
MSQFWTATGVTTTSGSVFVTIQTGDDVALISPNSFLQIGTNQFVEVKVVNTSASPQTIELFLPWNGGSASGQNAIAAPTKAEIKAAADEIRALRVTYEGIAGNISETAIPNTIVQRDANSRIKTGTPNAAEDAVNKGFLGTAATFDTTTSRDDTITSRLMRVSDFGLGSLSNTEYPKANLDDRTCPVGSYRLINSNPTAGTRPAGFSTFGYIQVYSYDADDKLQIFTDVNGRSAFRIIATGGNSAWKEYFHSGNSVNPLDFGLGRDPATNGATVPDGNIDSFTIPSGSYLVGSGNIGTKPYSLTGNGVLTHVIFTASRQGQYWLDCASNGLYTRELSNLTSGWQPWVEYWHSGNLVKTTGAADNTAGRILRVGSFGLADKAVAISSFGNNINTLTDGGFYWGYGGSHPTATGGVNPFPPSGGAFNVVSYGNSFGGDNATYTTQIATTSTSNNVQAEIKFRTSAGTANTFTDWADIFHSLNSVNPLDFGLGNDNNTFPPLIGNFNTVETSGVFRTVGGEQGTPQSSSIATVLNMRGGTTDRNNQVYVRADNSSNTVTAYIRGGLNIATPSYTDWVEILHTGNTNLNVFGGVGLSSLFNAVAKDATTLRAFLPISSVSKAQSITLSGGSSFEVRNASGGSFGQVTLSYASVSSNKLCVLEVSGASGLNAGETYDVRSSTATSTITVNF